MKRIQIAIIVTLVGIILVAASLVIYFTKLRPVQAGILVESTPSATVFFDGEQVGRTPYEAKRSPGEIVVKLVPISADQPLSPWETKVVLASGIKTVIRRTIGDSEDTSAGDIISFEKISSGATALSIVASPDASQISLDGQIRGFTPVSVNSLVAGEHQLVISSPNYLDRSLVIRAEQGFRLIAAIKLAKNPEATSSGTPQPQDEDSQEEEAPKVQVQILDTPTGFLRVRVEPSTSSTEAGRVEPGKKYDLLGENQTKDWYKIEYETGKEGWISTQYAKKITPSPTPSPKVSPTPKPTSQLVPTTPP